MVIIVVIVIVLFLGWIFNVSQRECRSNKDCGSESYCGSDFSCHLYPTITVVKYNLIVPSIIIGIAIIITAIIFKWNQLKPKDEIKQVAEETTNGMKVPEERFEEISESYYKSNGDIKTP